VFLRSDIDDSGRTTPADHFVRRIESQWFDSMAFEWDRQARDRSSAGGVIAAVTARPMDFIDTRWTKIEGDS